MEDVLKWADSPIWDKEPTKSRYKFPLLIDPIRSKNEGVKLSKGIPEKEVYALEYFICAKSPQSHIGPYCNAVDFLVPDNTPVVASRDGRVVEIQEQSASWGPTEEHRNTLNYLTISHLNGEFSQYCHLAQHSVGQSGIIVGALVKKGQQIALVGKSGWTDRDHLHFIVFKMFENESPFKFKSLYIQFE